MTQLYVVPVGKDWIDRFNETVISSIPVPEGAPEDLLREDEIRMWGAPEGPQNRRFFEQMESGDPILFYNQGEFFAAGRMGTAFESPQVGEDVWGNRDSRFIYTVDDIQDISVPLEKIADLLGYDDDWIPRRFVRASENALSSLLQQYNSVEEAFQDFQDGDEIDGLEEGGDDDDPREHTEIQWLLIQLGISHGYDVYVATNDKNRTYRGNRLGADCIENLNLPGFSPAATRIIKYVDVIWLEDDFIVKMFEVESTTSVYSGILRMTDFMVKVPNIAVEMHIVAPVKDEDKVREEIDRPTFKRVVGQAEHCSLQYLSFDRVRDTYETVQEAGALQEVF
jgi:hypothetical protein